MSKLTDKYKLKVCKNFYGDWIIKYKKKGSRCPFWKRVKVYDHYWRTLVKGVWADKDQAHSTALNVLGYSSVKYFHESELQKKKDYLKAKKAVKEMKKKRNESIIYE